MANRRKARKLAGTSIDLQRRPTAPTPTPSTVSLPRTPTPSLPMAEVAPVVTLPVLPARHQPALPTGPVAKSGALLLAARLTDSTGAADSRLRQLLDGPRGKRLAPCMVVASIRVGPKGNCQELLYRDMRRMLDPGKWVNDEVINFYMRLILKRQDEWHGHPTGPGAAAASRSPSAGAAMSCGGTLGSSCQSDNACFAVTHIAARNSCSPPRCAATVYASSAASRWLVSGDCSDCTASAAHLSTRDLHGRPDSGGTAGPSCCAFSSFFWSQLSGSKRCFEYGNVQRWTHPRRTFTPDCVLNRELLLFPINHGNTHWCLVAVWQRAHRIHYYDSFHGDGSWVLDVFERWIQLDLADKHDLVPQAGLSSAAPTSGNSCSSGGGDAPHQAPARPTSWVKQCVRGSLPRQVDGVSCGVFVCAYAELLSRGVVCDGFGFTQADVPKLRRSIAEQLLRVSIST